MRLVLILLACGRRQQRSAVYLMQKRRKRIMARRSIPIEERIAAQEQEVHNIESLVEMI